MLVRMLGVIIVIMEIIVSILCWVVLIRIVRFIMLIMDRFGRLILYILKSIHLLLSISSYLYLFSRFVHFINYLLYFFIFPFIFTFSNLSKNPQYEYDDSLLQKSLLFFYFYQLPMDYIHD